MAPDLPWPAIGALASGVGSLYLLARLREHWHKPGAKWFVATIGTITVWTGGYAVGILVATPPLRVAVEVLSWVSAAWIGFFFLSFALGYTGRTGILESWWYRTVAVVPLATSLLAVASTQTPLLWGGYEPVRVLGVLGAEYTFLPLGYVSIIGVMLFVSVGTVLLFDTVVSYGPLYRREAIAVGLSPLPPGIGALLWALGLGPPVNLTTVLFLPHVALDAYAFVRGGMFEFHPATRRIGERAAIDDIGTPVAIVDVDGRIVTLNPAAERTFGVDTQSVLTRPLGGVLGEEALTVDGEGERLSVGTDRNRREFKTQQTELRDETGTHLGYTVLFQDITDEIRRERRLEVLNRFLRHNVRNESVVIRGRAEVLAAGLEGEEAGHAETIEAAVGRLVESGEKARTLSEVSTGGDAFETVDVGSFLADAVDSLDPPAGERVTVSVADGLELSTQPVLLEVLVENLVENAVEHTDDPDVQVLATVDGGSVVLTVADDGPGIPEHELAVLDSGRETDLNHGSGIGLWLIRWVATTLGAELTFTVESGTTVSVRFPTEQTN
ncbi:histidine kinase N-terminal 7TM domain-containing protein [Haloarcula pelagica]|uniref:histidine kinase N-terminal 7TM domain-containing protein n=1 Tax=Haloarcula pelagica TaxID=3033389 RepID=UPI0024C26F8E|nr:histidine kinase N-terminal 7TM domain-containing protein [Halomicroarcula sp. YJ-61-S]